jgi:hypothetical protein
MKSIESGLQDLLEKQLKAKSIFNAVIAVKSGK